jgi:hypothetical protein
MTPSQLPWSLRTQQTAAAFYRAGYPIEEIADAIGLAPTECRELVGSMRRAGWLLRRPRGAHEAVQVDNALLRAGYLRRRAEARRADGHLSLSELARAAGLVVAGREPDPTYIGRLLGITPMPDGAIRVRIPLSAALALGEALGFDAHEIEAREVRPRPARFLAPEQGPPVLLAA